MFLTRTEVQFNVVTHIKSRDHSKLRVSFYWVTDITHNNEGFYCQYPEQKDCATRHFII